MRGLKAAGMAVLVFNTAPSACTLQQVADAARLNLSLNLTAQAPGEFCVGLYDVGDIHDTSFIYTVTVVHTRTLLSRRSACVRLAPQF
jgi:hypothetical protein